MASNQIIDVSSEGGPWLSITELAELKGVSKPTISEKVARLERDKGLITRNGAGGTKLVDVAQYDRLVGETSDLTKLHAASSARARRADGATEAAPPGESTWSEAQKRKTQYDAALKSLEYGERSRQLVATDGVKSVIEKILEPQLGAIDALVLRADEITAAAARDGVAGVRQILRDAIFKLKAACSAAWRELESIAKARDVASVEIDLQMPEEEEPQ
jgi:DNA-binding Lrp family transcriptional regulator